MHQGNAQWQLACTLVAVLLPLLQHLHSSELPWQISNCVQHVSSTMLWQW